MKKLVLGLLIVHFMAITVVSVEAQMVRQRGLLGALGIETPAMQSARQQTYVAQKVRQQAELEREKSTAAQDATADMLGVVRDELKLSVDEIKAQAVAAAKAEEETRELIMQVELLKAEAEKAKADADQAKADAVLAIVEAKAAQDVAVREKTLAENLKEQTAREIENLQSLKKVLDEEKEALAKAKQQQEEEEKQKQKDQEEHLSSLQAINQEDHPVVVVEEQPAE